MHRILLAVLTIIQTIAGGGMNDGRTAPSVPLGIPIDVAVDAAGNLYISEDLNHRVRKVDAATGTMTTVAEEGVDPYELTVDSAGNVYFIDGALGAIRKVSASTHIITTVAFGIVAADVAVDAAGNLFVADLFGSRIRRVDAITHTVTTVAGTTQGFAGDGGPATDAKLDVPIAVALDAAGNLYISDFFNQRIRKVDARTNVISTVAGNGESGYSGDGGPATAAQLNYPEGVAVDDAGNIYIADSDNARIRRVDAVSHNIGTIAGTGSGGFSGDGGPASAAKVGYATRVKIDVRENLYIADRSNLRIRKIDRVTNTITTVAGSAGDGIPATASVLLLPRGVVKDSAGNVFVADQANHRIRKIDAATQVISTIAGTGFVGFSGDGGPATAARLYTPFGLAIDASGNLYVCDDDNYRIRRIDAASGIITTVAGNGQNDFSGDGGPATAAALGETSGVAVDASGNLYIADPRGRIRRVDATTGIITTVAGTGSVLADAPLGDGGRATAATLFLPEGVAVDAVGNLYIADGGHDRIRRVDRTTNIITTVAGGSASNFLGDGGLATDAALFDPVGIAFDSANNLYIADRRNNRIRRVDAVTKIITTVAGNGTDEFAGDGGPATAAALSHPFGLTVDAAGNIYVTDTGNDRVRMISVESSRKRTVRPH
jgi:sugar lactone lactonase YvrE